MKDLSASLKAITPSLGVSIGGKATGALKWAKSYDELRKYILPYQVTVANASGTGNRAMWEFYQEEGMAANWTIRFEDIFPNTESIVLATKWYHQR
jgi:hypothetical protein